MHEPLTNPSELEGEALGDLEQGELPTLSDVEGALERVERLRTTIGRVFFGPVEVIDRLLTCLIAPGHALIEDVPGVGKTVLATALAKSLGCAFSRLQLTPDLLPADVLGVSILDRETGEFRFRRGPIFANIVLADEINRTTPRTQSALLEAMSEGAVSIEGRQHRLAQPFMVIATQNPITFEGTYPLPENQLDRFLMRFGVGYPSRADEVRVLDRRPGDTELHRLESVLSASEVMELRGASLSVRLDRSLGEYIVAIAEASRSHDELAVGISPRGTLALASAARATALLDGRDYVIPEDITANASSVCSHRIVGNTTLQTSDASAARGVMDEILASVPAPD